MDEQTLIVEMGSGGHHTVYSRIVLEGGHDGHFLVSPETWESLPATVRESRRAAVELAPPGIAWERRRQVAQLDGFLRAHPLVERCFVLSIVEIFLPLLRRQLLPAGGRSRAVVSGLWNVDNRCGVRWRCG